MDQLIKKNKKYLLINATTYIEQQEDKRSDVKAVQKLGWVNIKQLISATECDTMQRGSEFRTDQANIWLD